MKTLTEAASVIQQVNIIHQILQDDGQFPNNARLPLLIYKRGLQTQDPEIIKDLYESNSWSNAWTDTIFNFHHYHSKTHEVLAVFQGNARIQFGGPNGIVQGVEPGDVIIIPAGVAHCLLEGDDNFKVVGAYPDGKEYDLLKGEDGERPQADNNIRSLSNPGNDPLYGAEGPLLRNWE